MPINTATATIEDVRKAETSELLELYNKITDSDVKRFSAHDVAVKRTWKAIQQLAPGENIDETLKKTKKKTANSTPAKKEKKAGKRDGYEKRLIKMLITENPKRPNTRAHKKFELLMRMDGNTIAEYKKEEGRFPTLDMEKGWPATEIRWALKQGWMKIVNAA